MNGSLLSLTVSGKEVCNGVATGLSKSTSCTGDYTATPLGEPDILCTISDKAGNLVSSDLITIRISSSGGSTGSSGGGGSSSSSIVQEVLDISTEPQTAGIYSKQSTTFRYDSIDHIVTVESLTADSAILNIDNKITETLKVGDSKEFDLTSDNKNDIKITLNKILLNKADITIEKLAGATAEQQKETVTKKSSLWWLWMVLVVVIIGISVYIYDKKRVRW